MMNKLTCFLERLCQITQPGKKAVQKLVYLAERKGLDLGMDYCIHYYGPYSSELNQSLHALEAKDIVSIDTSGKTHKLKVNITSEKKSFSSEESQIITEIFEKYAKKTPLDLEVLTTTDYVASYLLDKSDLSDEKIIETVKSIKGDKFSKKQIWNSITSLRNDGLIQ